ncbi:MAG: hypothetical protein L6V93_22190 [Clostridiales bacterium]|nr:MAG: hypothetical protein L6V93_22190 [Clostridiales bacterium]
MNIRIKREVFGCADKLAEYITAGGNVKSTLIIGEPHSGKTTVLRDLARILSDRFLYRVAVADERGEIASSVNGTAKKQRRCAHLCYEYVPETRRIKYAGALARARGDNR